MANSRLVVVSNQDGRINYVGDWSLSNSSSFQSLGDNGPPLESTLHMTAASVNSFSFSFNGTYISVLGLITNSSSSQFTLECTVDGVTKSSSITTGENNVHLCTTPNLPDESHELIANISMQGSSFFLDNLQYAPSTDVPLNNATIIIPNIDSSIIFSPGWSQAGPLRQNMTGATNTSVNVSFIGNRVGWFGSILGSEPHAPSSAEYFIDNGPPIPFTLPGFPSGVPNTTRINNIPFFTSDVLEQGPHTLHVRYLGNSSVSPLNINNLLITNGPLSSSSSIFPSSASPPSLPSSSSPPLLHSETSLRGKPISAVVGVIGGIAGIGLIIALLFVFRRSRNSGLRAASNASVTPFSIDASRPEAHAHSLAPATRGSGLLNSVTASRGTKSGTTRLTSHTQTPVSPLHQGPSTESRPQSLVASAQGSNNSPLLITGSSNSNSAEVTPLVRVQHEDSGLRIVNLGMDNVVELPPSYTLV